MEVGEGDFGNTSKGGSRISSDHSILETKPGQGEILSVVQLSEDLVGSLEREVLASDPNVVFFGVRHNRQGGMMRVVCDLTGALIAKGRKPAFVGIELKSLDPDELSRSERTILRQHRPLIEFCEQNEIPVVAVDRGTEGGITTQVREDTIAKKTMAAYVQHGNGFVLIGEAHARKCSGKGSVHGIKRAANVVLDQYGIRVGSVLMHEMTKLDPLAREVDTLGKPVAVKGVFGGLYTMRPEDSIFEIFQEEIREEGPTSSSDHDLVILFPSSHSEINARFGHERTDGIDYRPVEAELVKPRQ